MTRMARQPEDRTMHEPLIADRSIWVPPRLETPELLDQGAGTADEVAVNLIDMERANRYLGGLRALTMHLYPRLLAQAGAQPDPTPIRLLDLGTGAAEVPARISRWTERHKIPVQIAALDLSARNLSVARKRVGRNLSPVLLQADAIRLPFGPRSVDYVISAQFLHHLPPDALVAMLREARRCARRGLILTDLVRGWVPLAGFWLLQPVATRNFLSRHDGILSIRRAYTLGELRQLVRAAGLAVDTDIDGTRTRISVHWPWRMTLVAEW